MMPLIGFHSVIDRPDLGQAGDAADHDHQHDQPGDGEEPHGEGRAAVTG